MMEPSYTSLRGGHRRAISLLLCLAMLATLLPAVSASADHVEPRRPQTVLLNGLQQVADSSELPERVGNASVNADGTKVVFEAYVRGGCFWDIPRDCWRLWLFEREPGDVHGRLRPLDMPVVGEDGRPDNRSLQPAISGDGRYVAFITEATNFVGPDTTNGYRRAYRYDLLEGELRQVDVHGDGIAPFEDKEHGQAFDEGVEWHRPAISHDGSVVAFTSLEFHGAGSTVYVWNAEDGHATVASVRVGGGFPTGIGSGYPSLSPDGRWLAYQTSGDMRHEGPYTEQPPWLDELQVWLQELEFAGVEAPILVSEYEGEPRGGVRASVSDPVAQANGLPFVAFSSWGGFGYHDPEDGHENVFRWDGNGGEPRFDWLSAPGPSYLPWSRTDLGEPSISADGARVAFGWGPDGLVDDDTNEVNDVYVATIRDGDVSIERASVATDGSEGERFAWSTWEDWGPVLSADGSSVVFNSEAVLDAAAREGDPSFVYLRDLAEGGEDPEEPATFTAGIQPLTASPQAGSPTNVQLSFHDGFATPDTRHHYTLSWGDGTVAERIDFPRDAEAVEGGGAAGTIDLSHTYETPGGYTLTLLVHASDGPGVEREAAAEPRGISVAAAPVLTVGPLSFTPQPAREGSEVTVSFSVSDSHGRDLDSVDVDWGDGTSSPATPGMSPSGTVPFSASHAYRRSGTYDVTATATTIDGATSSTTSELVVDNVPPQILDVEVLPGRTPRSVDLEATFTDPGLDDTHSATVDFGDGTGPVDVDVEDISFDPVTGLGTVTAWHDYAVAGDYWITVEVSDDSGGSDVWVIEDHRIENPPGTVAIVTATPFPDGLQEGDEVGLEVIFGDDVDRGDYEWEVLWDASEEPPRANGTTGVVMINDWEYGWQGSAVTHHTYVQDGTYLATVRIRPAGADGWADSRDVEIEVANAAPRILDLGVTPEEGEAPLDVDLHAIFSDAGIEDTHDVTIDWGDGATSDSRTGDDVSVNWDEDDAEWAVSASHTYLEAGEHTVTLVVTDDAGDEDRDTVEVAVTAPSAGDRTIELRDLRVTHPSQTLPAIAPVVKAGARAVPIANIPLADLAPSGSGVESAPLHRIDLAAAPLHRIPLHRIPLHRIPLHRIDLPEEAPLTMGDLALDALPLGQLPLTVVPLRRAGGWNALLSGTALAGVPLQTVTLADVHALDLLAGLAVDEVDLAATPLRELSLASILLGDVPLEDVPLPDGVGTDWCTYLATLGHPCDGFDDTAAVLGAEFHGVPLDGSGITAAPLHRIDVQGTPLHRIDVQGIPLHRIPLHRIPLHRIDLQVSPLHRIPLHRIPLHRIGVQETPLHRIPLHRIPLHRIGEIVDCAAYDCTEAGGKTLADAFEAGVLLDTATLGALGQLPDDLVLGHLLYLIAVAIEAGEDPDGLAISFNDVLLGLLEAMDYPWEELPFGRMGVSRFAPYTGEAPLRYSARFEVAGDPGASDATVRFRLPEGFTVVPPPAAAGPMAHVFVPGAPERWVEASIDGDEVTVVVDDAPHGQEVRLSIDVRPGITLGTWRSDAAVELGGLQDPPGSAEDGTADEVVDAAPVVVVEHWEEAADNAPETAPQLASDTVYLAHLGTPGDIDHYRIPIDAPGQRISIRLTNLDEDADLVLYQPVDPSAAPLHRISTDSLPIGDEGYASDAARRELVPETLQDVPVRVSPLHRISANRGDADETIEAVATGADVAEGYVIQVSGYNGASSDTPYVLRVRITDPLPAPECTNTFAFGPSSATSAWAAPTSTTDTLVLFNEQRLRRLHDGAEVDEVVEALEALVATSPAHGADVAVVPIDQLADVTDAYGSWDAPGKGCDPAAANEVVHAITGHVDALRSTHPAIANVVAVGGDDVIPFARVPDTTRLSQLTYADLVGDVNPISAAFATEHVLSDDPYGDATGTPWLNRTLHVSEIAVGRLVESPTDIAAQLHQFVFSGGILDPDSAVVSGYDFLDDGAFAVADALRKPVSDRQPIVPTELIDEDWTRQDVVDALFDGPESPGIASINAHYDHSRSLPALPHAEDSHDPDDLFTVGDLEPDRLMGRILFTMGCHAGLAIPDHYVGSQTDLAEDWAQVLGAELAVYVANTGYGYGDDTAVALSELLMAELADRLDGTMTIGDALAAAKHAYVGQMGVYGSYDEKVVQQTVLYGLPMYRVGPEPDEPAAEAMSAFATSSAAATGVVTDPVTGLPVSPVGIHPAGTFQEVTTDRGTYWQLPGQDPQVTHWRPIQPKAVVDVTRDGLEARGALITGLASTDTMNVDAVFARPAVGSAAHEPEVESGGVAFPARLSNLTTTGGPEGHRDRLALLPGQFFSEVDSGSTRGVQRLYTRMDALVYYGEPGDDDVTPPQISRAEAVTDDGLAGFTIATDDPSGVERVLVLFKDATGKWTALDLQDAADGTWAGAAAADVGGDPAEPTLEWFVQAVDGAGNVAASTNKGGMFPAVSVSDDPDEGGPSPIPGPGPQAPTLDGPLGEHGWFTGPVTVTGDGVASTTLTEDGIHLVTVSRNGSSATYFVPIDQTKPTVEMTSPATSQQVEPDEPLTAGFSCGDATSGIATCTAVVVTPDGTSTPVRDGGTLPTATLGVHDVRVTAFDRAGNSAEASRQYTVAEPSELGQYRFDGFYKPIDNDGVNVVKAGQSVPVKFRLFDGSTSIGDVSKVGVLVQPSVGCESGQATNTVVDTVPASAGEGLKWDPDDEQFVFIHRTDRKWQGNCGTVRFTISHPDGSTTTEEVRFRYTK